MAPPSGSPHSPSAHDLLTMEADAATAGVLVPWAASQPGADGGKKPGGDGDKKPGADGGEKLGADGGEKQGDDGGEKLGADGGEKPGADGGEKQGDDGGKKPGGDGDKMLGADGGKKRATPIVRVWSEADEVRILEALAAYTAAHGEEPRRSQLRAALDGCRLDKAEFTVTEIYEKVRRLRTKYGNLRSAGGVPAPADDDGDEARKYQLSRSIWGDRPLSIVKNHATKASANANAAPVRRGVEELQGLYPSLALAVEGITNKVDESLRPMLKRAFQLISDERASELDAKVKKQMVLEAQMTLKETVVRNQKDIFYKSGRQLHSYFPLIQ